MSARGCDQEKSIYFCCGELFTVSPPSHLISLLSSAERPFTLLVPALDTFIKISLSKVFSSSKLTNIALCNLTQIVLSALILNFAQINLFYTLLVKIWWFKISNFIIPLRYKLEYNVLESTNCYNFRKYLMFFNVYIPLYIITFNLLPFHKPFHVIATFDLYL